MDTTPKFETCDHVSVRKEPAESFRDTPNGPERFMHHYLCRLCLDDRSRWSMATNSPVDPMALYWATYAFCAPAYARKVQA